jgi:hypothetical protein
MSVLAAIIHASAVGPDYKEAIEIHRTADPDQYPDSLNDLGLLYCTSRYRESAQLFKQVIDLYRPQS